MASELPKGEGTGGILPSGVLIANLVHLPMVPSADLNGELVADFLAERSRLSGALRTRSARSSCCDVRGHVFNLLSYAKAGGSTGGGTFFSIWRSTCADQ